MVVINASGTADLPVRTAQEGSVAVAEAHPDAIVMHGLVEVEFREILLEIYELDPERRLVTCIEILSPSNKRFPSVGWYQFDRKRQVFLKGYANLVEIDLLRGGRQMPMEEPWPDSPYFHGHLPKRAGPRRCRSAGTLSATASCDFHSPGPSRPGHFFAAATTRRCHL